MNSFLGVGVYGGQVYPEPEPESTPEPVNPITKQFNPFFMDMDMNINSNAPAWYSSLLNYINNIRAYYKSSEEDDLIGDLYWQNNPKYVIDLNANRYCKMATYN